MANRPQPINTDDTVTVRPQPMPEVVPDRLSRERIVRAAISIADAHGLGAVSLRNVSAALSSAPTRLYTYVSTKEELHEVMVDAVHAEILAMGPFPNEWRNALRTVAHRTRDAARLHKWFMDLVGRRPQVGPNSLALLEASLAAILALPGFDDVDAALQALATLNAYTLGAIRSEVSEHAAEGMIGTSKKAATPYMYKMIATGRFPVIAQAVRETKPPTHETSFDRGLECVLDGIAVRIRR